MEPIDKALQELNIQDKPNISAVAKSHNINRSVLSRRYNGVATSTAVKYQKQQLLSPHQEQTLVRYINTLTERAMPPTVQMVNNFAFEIAQKEPGKNWSQGFCKRWKDTLDSRYLQNIDSTRTKADNHCLIERYFDLLGQKIHQYEILPQICTIWTRKASQLGS